VEWGSKGSRTSLCRNVVTTDILLFILRITSGLVLLGFVLLVFVAIRRDIRLASDQVAAQSRGHGRLVVTDSGGLPVTADTAYPLLPVTTIGRAPTNTVQLPDSFASTHHALLALRSGQWWLEDRESRNGTLLNGQFLTGPTVVTGGDVIGIGRIELKVELD
jgi:hypothetical protein